MLVITTKQDSKIVQKIIDNKLYKHKNENASFLKKEQ